MEYVTVTIPLSLRDDFVEAYGWDKLVQNIGSERAGMRDAWTAVEFAAPKGKTSVVIRVPVKLLNLLRQMLEVRWADHFQTMSDLEPAYARVTDQLRVLVTKKMR